MSPPDRVSRMCREVQAHLAGVVDGTLPRWRRRLVDRHLRRCEDCGAELARQHELAAGFRELGSAAASPGSPPEGLLDTLLQQAEHPGLRGRAAVPARGAVSGARPALSVVLLVVAATVGSAAGYAAWRALRAVAGRLGSGSLARR